jgi:predicted nucleotidyltransferase
VWWRCSGGFASAAVHYAGLQLCRLSWIVTLSSLDAAPADGGDPVSLQFDAVHDQIAELCRRYGIAELSVFGSVARGDDRPDSDVDLLYVSASDSTSSLWELWKLRDELTQLLGRKIDLVSKDNLHWVIRDRVLNEAMPVYAA